MATSKEKRMDRAASMVRRSIEGKEV
ncbi:hypothetical protein A2U01_0116571, partial [Trifolium medium]|nr:hypothetical protein [Trifolium medium]